MEEELRKQEEEELRIAQLEQQVKKKERDEKVRQAICESSWELRELESKLKNAYVVKERLVQIKDNEAKKQRERVRFSLDFFGLICISIV